ncbi:hypothetical protein SO802_017990 [Lithocarpus litseifolius]|uniref:RNase H type-1 domain-containing protein n=1 Tax=Lithocarpus litseifolius TaxID=425828 RepID=A0AAW2CLW9_9ROSI
MVEDAQTEVVAKLATGAWCIWNTRNEMRAAGVRNWDARMRQNARHPHLMWPDAVTLEGRCCLHIGATSRAALEMEDRGGSRNTGSVMVPSKCTCLQDKRGWCNIHEARNGLGVLVRYELGRVIAALSKRVQAPLGAVEAKAKAFEAGMQFAKDIGIQDFILEGDSLTIYRALSGLSNAPTSVDSVVQGLLSFSKKFRKVSFSRALPYENTPAHFLAKHAKGIVDFST